MSGEAAGGVNDIRDKFPASPPLPFGAGLAAATVNVPFRNAWRLGCTGVAYLGTAEQQVGVWGGRVKLVKFNPLW